MRCAPSPGLVPGEGGGEGVSATKDVDGRVRGEQSPHAAAYAATSARPRRREVSINSHAHALELPLRAEAPEILRRDRFQRISRDAETFKRQPGRLRRIRHDIVAREQRHLVRRQLERARARIAGTRPGDGQARTTAAPASACDRRSRRWPR